MNHEEQKYQAILSITTYDYLWPFCEQHMIDTRVVKGQSSCFVLVYT